MSLWEFVAALGGWAKANGADDDNALSSEDAKRLAAGLDTPPVWH